MWHNIKQVLLPKTLEEAVGMMSPGAAYFAGGTYLVAERPHRVETLIDINGLIDHSIRKVGDDCLIGAGATVQQFLDSVPASGDPFGIVAAAKNSSFSKNIRNQRTIGGEIARGRENSDLFVLLTALDPKLTVAYPDIREMHMSEWDMEGIITRIVLPMDGSLRGAYHRFALIESAPPFVVIAVARHPKFWMVAVGGRCSEGSHFICDDLSDENVAVFAHGAAEYFSDDHLGSVGYKETVIATGIRRGREELCK